MITKMKSKAYCIKRIFIVFVFMSLFMVFQVSHPELLIILSASMENDVCSDPSDPILGVPNSLMKIENCSRCQKITCRSLLFGGPVQNKSLSRKAIDLMLKYSDNFNEPRRNETLEMIGKSCEGFKQWRGYDLSTVTQEEMHEGEPFSIAFNILGHEGFEQTERLLRSIYRPQNSYCFHIDKKSTEMVSDIKLLSSCFDNVFVASKLEYIIYAGFSRLQADLNCMKDQMKRKEKWRYLINTASTGFPLKSNKELVQILKILNGSNIIVTIPTEGNSFLISRYKYIHEVHNGTLLNTNVLYSPPPYNLTIVKGSAYGIFSRPFINFILTDSRAQGFLKWSKKTYSPDEMFWNTLHHTYSNPHIDAPGGLKGSSLHEFV